jgi:HK97 family phage portal protein
VNVSAETALMSSAVWGCTRLIAESIAMMPIITYRRQSDGGKSRAWGHPLYDILHDDPNEQQTAFVWKRTMLVQALLYGGGYSRIVPGARGAVDQLVPIHADTIRVEQLADGGIRYQVRGPNGLESPLNAEDVFHLPGLSIDGINGMGLVQYARESIGLALAAEAYSAKFYAQNAQPGGLIKSPSKLDDTRFERLRDQWESRQQGPDNWHRVAILEGGAEWVQTGISPADAQLIEQLDWSAADVARFFNVPLHMIQLMTKSTSWGTGIEEMGIQFVTYTLQPWIQNFEQLIRKKLVVASRLYFAEFLMDSLMRGKLVERYQAYATGRQWGWLSVNDVRQKENMNPVENGDGYMQPLNMSDLGAPPPVPAKPLPPGSKDPPSPAKGGGANQGHYYTLVHEAAGRVVRKETAAMGKAAGRCSCQDAWVEAVREFYATHPTFVQQVMGIDQERAEQWAAEQMAELLEGGAGEMADWETRRVGDLVALAMGKDGRPCRSGRAEDGRPHRAAPTEQTPAATGENVTAEWGFILAGGLVTAETGELE